MIMEAETSHDLLSAIWPPSKIKGIIQTQSLNAWESVGVKSVNPNTMAGKMQCPNLSIEADERDKFLLCLPFCSNRTSTD